MAASSISSIGAPDRLRQACGSHRPSEKHGNAAEALPHRARWRGSTCGQARGGAAGPHGSSERPVDQKRFCQKSPTFAKSPRHLAKVPDLWQMSPTFGKRPRPLSPRPLPKVPDLWQKSSTFAKRLPNACQMSAALGKRLGAGFGLCGDGRDKSDPPDPLVWSSSRAPRSFSARGRRVDAMRLHFRAKDVNRGGDQSTLDVTSSRAGELLDRLLSSYHPTSSMQASDLCCAQRLRLHPPLPPGRMAPTPATPSTERAADGVGRWLL